MERFFDAMTKAAYTRDGAIEVGGRAIAFRRRAKGVIWFDFAELCQKPRSQVDFLEIAASYHTVMLSGVERMQPSQTDVVRRFTWLVDVFYDQRVKLVMSAQAQPEELVVAAPQAAGPERMVRNEFARTASRLREMQSREYFSRKHASADNPRVLERP
jgi:cell division protein ZapE